MRIEIYNSWTHIKNDQYQSATLYRYSTVPYSTATWKTHEKVKIQYRTQYSRNTVDTVVYSEFRGTVPVFTVIFYEFQNFDKSFKYLVFFCFFWAYQSLLMVWKRYFLWISVLGITKKAIECTNKMKKCVF